MLLKICVLCWCAMCSMTNLFAQDEIKPWERLGLSLTEWKLIQDNNLPMSKVEELLLAGIGISEYFDEPWKDCHLSEEKYIEMRRSGLTHEEIVSRQAVSRKEFLKNQKPAENNFERFDNSSERRQLYVSFFAPGWLQLKDERKTTGKIMLGLAAGSVAATVGMSIYKKQFISLPLFVVVVPMVWSMTDQKKHHDAVRRP